MGIVDVVRTLVQVPTLLAVRKGLAPRPPAHKDCFGAQVQRNAEAFPDRTAVLFEERELSWSELNALSNRYAHVFSAQGLQHGDVASLFMENRIEFLATVVALNKLGVVAALINSNLHGRQLAHCINATDSKMCIFGEERLDEIEDVSAELGLQAGTDFFHVPDAGDRSAPPWALDLSEASSTAAADNPPITNDIMLQDNALYIFTSGTTGLPKAAVMSNGRFLRSSGLAHKALYRCTEQDRLYVCLPLYHATGLMIGVGAAFSSGASLFLRRRFSASNFLPEVRRYNTNLLIYIGEMCRYLMETPVKPDDADNPLTVICGNGMRPDVWLPFKNRYGIKRVSEFYGASEGNVAFANLLNKDCTVGMTPSRIALVAYDVDADEIIKDSSGRCIEVNFGEPGLLLGHINEEAVFEGYTDPEATEAKIVRNVFEEGDAWFNTGDLMRAVDAGYTLGYTHYQFVDRVGDTFRWKSENVSTNEVGEIINGFHQISFCNVYGVEIPGADGRAGMAALALVPEADSLDLDGFAQHVAAELPSYARPVFLRIQKDIDVTGTFKMLKGELRAQGYDLDAVDEQLFVMKPGSDRYVPLEPDFAAQIAAGKAGY